MDATTKIPILDITEFSTKESKSDFLYHEIKGKRLIEKPHKHDFFLFMLFVQGSGTHTIDFVDYDIAAAQLHILFPEQIHKWAFNEETYAHQIMISRNMFETLVNSLRFSLTLYQNYPVISLNNATLNKILYEFEQIKLEFKKPSIFFEIINTRVKLIALMISEEAETIFNNQTVYKTKPILFKYRSLVDTYCKSEKLVSFYANELNISANYLNILCKKHFHVSATALIHERLILEIKRMLLTTEKPIKAIASELGFYDIAYFSKFFKKYTQTTPKVFRGKL